jgi:hypothetical protein
MSDNWYIARGDQQLGPYTVFELKELGMAGQVEATDEIWKEGMPNRVPATKVKGLLPVSEIPDSGAGESAPAALAEENSEEPAGAEPQAPKTPEQLAEERRKAAAARAATETRKRRVTASKGAIITAQDGKEVRFRKKCVTCGTEDRGKSMMPLRPGTTRTSFFCPSCRRLKPVEITAM